MRLEWRGIILGFAGSVSWTLASPAQEPPSPDKPQAPRGSRSLEDPVETFVPLKPRTVEERNQVEALRLYTVARALEDRHKLTDALDVLEDARKLDPDSPPILRRLSRINLILRRGDQAVAVAKKLIEVDPNDSSTLALLVSHYLETKNDPVAAEALLRRVASSPKLNKGSAGFYLVLRDLGDINADLLNKPDEAADAYARLMNALDDRAANNLSPEDQARILEGDEASAYAKFGDTFLKAKRTDYAILAFRKGLIYKPDHAVLPRLLAEALYRSGKKDEALAVLEPFLKRLPTGSESYELLSEILISQGREKEILPRLEAAASADPKNLRVQFALAERLKFEGQVEKADALLAELLKNQAEPQVFAELARSYLKENKSEDLVRLLGEAIQKPGGIDAVKATLDALADNREAAIRALDAGLKMQETVPPSLSESSRKILAFVANKAKLPEKLADVDRAAVKADPTPANFRELIFDLFRATKYTEAGVVIQELFEKHPAEKNAPTLLLLARSRFFGGEVEPALAVAREALAVQPNDRDSLEFLAFLLGQLGKDDEAITTYEGLLKAYPNDEEVLKRARQGLSTSYNNKGDAARAEAELQILLEKFPDDPGVNNDLGYLFAEQGRNLEKAEGMIRKALEDEPDNSSYLDSLGWVLFKQGKSKEALLYLEKAAAGERLDVTICEHLGDVLFRLQDYPRARDFWKKAEGFAAKTSPPSKRLADIQKKLVELQKLGPAPKPSGVDGP